MASHREPFYASNHPGADGTMVRTRWVLGIVLVLASTVTVLAVGAQAQILQPDLEVVEVYTDPDPPEAGSQAQLLAEVQNNGDADSNGFTFNFSVDGVQLGDRQPHQGIPQGQSEIIQAPVPWDVTAGEHTVAAAVQHNDTQTNQDSDNSNNRTERTYVLGADLRIKSFTVDPKQTVAGEDVTLSATVRNAADEDVNDSFPVQFTVDGTTAVAPVTVEGLDGTSEVTVSRTWSATEGTHSIEVEADPDASIPDRNRTNNEAGPKTVEVRPARPDLVVGGLSVTPDPPRPGEQVTFTANLGNIGSADAGAYRVALFVGNTTVDTARVDGLPEGDETNATLSWTAREGVHEIEAVVDVADNVTESNEGNNVWTQQLSVGADLNIQGLDIQPSQPREGDRVRFTVAVGNDGLDVDRSFQVSFAIDGSPLGSSTIAGLDSESTRNATSSAWTARIGDHNLTVIVDPQDQIAEVDRENNQRTRSFTVGEPKPDVAVLSAGLDPAAPEDGNETTVKAQIANAGARAAPPFTVTARIDGEEVGRSNVGRMEPGNRTTIDVGTWTARTGAHELEVVADPDDDLDELDEDNNTLRRPFSIGADLAAVELSVSPSSPEPGENATASLIVRNNGTTQTPATSASFSLGDNELGRVNVSQLAPNQETVVELSFTATRSATIEARVDPGDEIDEVEEENNALEAELEVAGDAGPADLTVRAIRVAGNPGEDEEVTLGATVANVGDGPAGGALVTFRVDGETVGSPADLAGLAAGEEANVTGPRWSPSGGAHEIQVEVDPENSVPESDETNNALTRSIEGGPTGIPFPAWIALLAPVIAAFGARRT